MASAYRLRVECCPGSQIHNTEVRMCEIRWSRNPVAVGDLDSRNLGADPEVRLSTI
jgi:hypothetical protein